VFLVHTGQIQNTWDDPEVVILRTRIASTVLSQYRQCFSFLITLFSSRFLFAFSLISFGGCNIFILLVTKNPLQFFCLVVGRGGASAKAVPTGQTEKLQGILWIMIIPFMTGCRRVINP